jgi:hypothetical protein
MRDTIDMAREVGANFYIDDTARVLAHWKFTAGQLKAFEALVRADEREACAKVCEEYDDEYDVHTKQTVEGIALQIRARGNT